MSKTFETKGKILDILKEGAKTPAEIGRALKLSPSTISQHLKELREAGRIEEFTDEHFKNIKYFKRPEHPAIFTQNISKFVAGLAALAALGLLVAYFHSNILPSNYGAGYVSVLLTDPPHVPSGTQALFVSYSSLKVLLSNNSGTFWKQINTSGTVNLLSLVNFSKNLSAFNLPANSIVKRMSMRISNATITVNGTTYPVALTNNNISVSVFYSAKNTSAYNILLDLFPTVSAVVSANQTTFVMSPSATAATVVKNNSNPSSTASREGLIRLSDGDEKALRASRANISITNASISVFGNETVVSITVKDNSNYSTRLFRATVYGNTTYELNINTSRIPLVVGAAKMPRDIKQPYQNQVLGDVMNFTHSNLSPEGISGQVRDIISMKLSNATAQALMENLTNDSQGRAAIGNIIRSMGHGDMSGNLSGYLNSGRIIDDIASANYARTRLLEFHSVSFFIKSNGTMSLPVPIGIIRAGSEHDGLVMPASMFSEYNLTAGQTAALKYSGTMQFANGRLGVQFKPGQRYTIVVTGEDGAAASINVTAS